MPSIELHITLEEGALDSINKKFGNLTNALRAPMRDSLEDLQSWVTQYPGPFTGKMNFVSERQRRYVMWAIRSGVIQVPYVRTGKLGASWTIHISSLGNGLQGELAPSVSYARWVQSSQSQAYIHRGRWRTDQQALDTKRAEIVQRFRDALQQALA